MRYDVYYELGPQREKLVKPMSGADPDDVCHRLAKELESQGVSEYRVTRLVPVDGRPLGGACS